MRVVVDWSWSLGVALVLAAVLTGCVPEDPPPYRVGDLMCDLADYPTGPFGTEGCDRVRDLCFEVANEYAIGLAGEDAALALSDLYADESVVGVLLFGTAGWCQYCTQEAAWLNSLYPGLQDVDGEGGRIEIVAVVFQDERGRTATQEYAQAYAEYKHLVFPAVADTSGDLLDYFDPSAAPGNVFVSTGEMQIEQVLQGFDQEALERALDALDGSSACQ